MQGYSRILRLRLSDLAITAEQEARWGTTGIAIEGTQFLFTVNDEGGGHIMRAALVNGMPDLTKTTCLVSGLHVPRYLAKHQTHWYCSTARGPVRFQT